MGGDYGGCLPVRLAIRRAACVYGIDPLSNGTLFSRRRTPRPEGASKTGGLPREADMRESIHPAYPTAKVHCACGATWETRSTHGELHLDICSNCHPFFAGKQKLLDTQGRIDRFKKKYANSPATPAPKKKAAPARKEAPKAGPKKEKKAKADKDQPPRPSSLPGSTNRKGPPEGGPFSFRVGRGELADPEK